MKRIINAIVIVSSVLLINIAPAAAHKVVSNTYHQPDRHYVVIVRDRHMPAWLKRNESFRRWHKTSSLRKNRHLSWGEMYQVFRWERAHRARRYDRNYANHSYDWYRRYWNSRYYSSAPQRFVSNRHH